MNPSEEFILLCEIKDRDEMHPFEWPLRGYGYPSFSEALDMAMKVIEEGWIFQPVEIIHKREIVYKRAVLR